MSAPRAAAALADQLDAALPQTQCTRCGYPDCRSYAQAMASAEADFNRCPPGGAEGVARLAAVLGATPKPLDFHVGTQGPRLLALIQEAQCIGCTLCISACPVDCILGAPKRMHSVIASQCTGCELCVPACPVDCISMAPISGQRSAWQAWSAPLAQAARDRHQAAVQQRRKPRPAGSQGASVQATSPSTSTPQDKHAVVQAALARARAQRAHAG